MLEALASGVPVAGFPVPGPLDIIGRDGRGRGGELIGALDEDLATAVARALGCSRDACVQEAGRYDWARCAGQFLDGLAPRSKASSVRDPTDAPSYLHLLTSRSRVSEVSPAV